MSEEAKKEGDGNPLGGVLGFFGDATKGLTDSVSSIASPSKKEGEEEKPNDFFGGLIGSIQGAAADAQKAAQEAADNAQKGIPGLDGEKKDGEKNDDPIGGFFSSIGKNFEDVTKGVQGMVPEIPGMPKDSAGASDKAADMASSATDQAEGLASKMADDIGPKP